MLKNRNDKLEETIALEVNDFFSRFKDNPEHTSRWGHHYFCSKDGGLLIFDDKLPNEHRCSICGTVYSNELLNGVWVTMYRNSGVTNAWKSALLYKLTGNEIYLDNIKNFAKFYADHYLSFTLHNKEGLEFEDLDTAKWGASRIMPQSLNEAIFMIRLINGLELIKSSLDQTFIDELEEKMFNPAFEMMKPQVNKIHNISCWLNSAIGTMGHFLGNKEMIEFCYQGEFDISSQLQKGVTDDYFWYEGSIHYNYFTLEGITNLLLFSKLYDYDFKVGAEVIEKMLISAYEYAFDNHSLPNPNDGWPDVNLKTYSYIYALGARIYGEESRVANLFKNIVNKETERATIPLSKPYYFENDISLEEYIFVPNLRKEKFAQEKSNPISFPTSYCGKIKNDRFELFYKYGHNGPSHAHPDKMTIEVSIDNKVVSRDLSNSGYGNVYCNEWHRVSASHNTCVLNGQNHKSTDKGEIHLNEDNHVIVTSNNVYEGIDYKRELKITDNQLKDQFTVSGTENDVVDYFLHFEGDLSLSENLEPASLVFDQNGYQHIEDVKKVISKSDDITLTVYIDDIEFNVKCNTKGKELFITKTPDNPITNLRSTLILRSKEKDPVFDLLWEI